MWHKKLSPIETGINPTPWWHPNVALLYYDFPTWLSFVSSYLLHSLSVSWCRGPLSSPLLGAFHLASDSQTLGGSVWNKASLRNRWVLIRFSLLMVWSASVPLCVCVRLCCFCAGKYKSVLQCRPPGASCWYDALAVGTGNRPGLVLKCRRDFVSVCGIGLKTERPGLNQGQSSKVSPPSPALSHTWPPVLSLKRQEGTPVTVSNRGHRG